MSIICDNLESYSNEQLDIGFVADTYVLASEVCFDTMCC